ncbi:rhodanese-like domain-containing protein [Alteromonas halophila]|uniref:Rhodanese-like domain-containing protein n=1 Tax=Alteromonas halophila TaxID=516698 RepID=A0A918N0K7_9ALTE|nr:rhodanese-like domain-containing protein [Alteromonas halophila]GGW89886.1 rhodanese-like domain-containing protein [Alteromonas halophila]
MLLTISQRLERIPYPIRTVTAEEANTECQQNGGDIIDVREAAERENDPIDGSIHIPRGVLEMQALEKFKQAEQPLYIHCASGARAQLAAEQLIAMGYQNVSAISCALPAVKDALNQQG